MLLNVASLIKKPYVEKAIQNEQNLGEFRNQLNKDVKDLKFALQFGFENKTYSMDECKDLVRDIIETINKPLKEIAITRSEKIPMGAILDFIEAAHGEGYDKVIANAADRIVALHGKELAGFTTIDVWSQEQLLEVSVVYVCPQFRGIGVAEQLIISAAREARRRDLRGIDITRMMPKMESVVEKLIRRWKKQVESTLQGYVYEWDESGVPFARIVFRDKMTKKEIEDKKYWTGG